MLNLEPVKLTGEGEYNINVITEIKATESYLGMDQDITKCQKEEPLYNCTTRIYLQSILRNCGCLPLRFQMLKNEVNVCVYNTYCTKLHTNN